MKILIVGGNPNALSGTELVVRNIAKILASNNEVSLFTSLPVFLKSTKNYGNNVKILEKSLPYTTIKECIKNSFNYLTVLYPYLKFTPRGIASYFIALFYSVLLKEYLINNKPDIIHINGINLEVKLFITEFLEKNIPFIITMHGVNSCDPNIKLNFKKDLEQKLLNELKDDNILITTVSKDVKKLIVKNFNYPSEMINVIGNGVDINKFSTTRHSKKKLRGIYNIPDKIILLQIGTISKLKNHIAVLKAINNISPRLKDKLLYVIIGNGPEKDNLMNYIKKNDLHNNVTFLGMIQNENLPDWYHLSDFFILPSTSEGFPLVFLESIASGLPIITFNDLEGVKDIYQPYLMELIEERSIEAISQSIENAISKKWDKEQIINYAQKFDWESVCARYIECYEKAILINKI